MTHDPKGDRLADDALIAILRLLVHAEGGTVVGEDPGGDEFEAYDAEIVGMVERSVRNYRRKVEGDARLDGPELMVSRMETAGMREFLDGHWDLIEATMDAFRREVVRRRTRAKERPDGPDAPPLGLE